MAWNIFVLVTNIKTRVLIILITLEICGPLWDQIRDRAMAIEQEHARLNESTYVRRFESEHEYQTNFIDVFCQSYSHTNFLITRIFSKDLYNCEKSIINATRLEFYRLQPIKTSYLSIIRRAEISYTYAPDVYVSTRYFIINVFFYTNIYGDLL